MRLAFPALVLLAGCGVDFETLQHGESDVVAADCPDPVRCCEEELHLHLAADQGELEALFAVHLPGEAAPAMTVDEHTAVLAFTTWCATRNHRLRVEGVRGWSRRLSLDTHLQVRPNPIDEPGRPYTVIEVEGEWSRATGDLASAHGQDTG